MRSPLFRNAKGKGVGRGEGRFLYLLCLPPEKKNQGENGEAKGFGFGGGGAVTSQPVVELGKEERKGRRGGNGWTGRVRNKQLFFWGANRVPGVLFSGEGQLGGQI